MRPYFEKMTGIGKALTEATIKQTEANVGFVREVEKQLQDEVDKVRSAGLPAS